MHDILIKTLCNTSHNQMWKKHWMEIRNLLFMDIYVLNSMLYCDHVASECAAIYGVM